MPGFDAAVVEVEELARDEGADHGAGAVGDEGEADFGGVEVVAGGEEGGHGCDAHLPDGVVDGEKEDDGSGVFADEDAEGAGKVDVFPLC